MNLEWTLHARCRGMDPNIFFPSGVGALGRKQAEEAAAICRQCPVIVQCDRYGKATGAAFGVWAGRLLNDKNAAPYPADVLFPHGTEAGYKRHIRRDETPCAACREGATREKAARAGR